ncbi:MAG: glutamyl-tRNA reductase [Syntrophomonadaceae bacterium]|jgi:glutamyl-tRNA reductase|nr:glutamyl-tRNA reductase [Syntrophomonadaceae bacterium]
MYVLLVGINHRTAPVEIREKLAFTGGAINQAYEYLRQKENLEGAVILHTCNRTEVYATARDIQLGMEALSQFMDGFSQFTREEMKQYLYQPNCYDAILNLFRVASGLDSMILGESQILGQVKEAYQMAREEKASDGVLNTLFQQAINVGKRVRSETDIDRHPISVSSVAVELARSQLGSLQGKSVVVVGAGEMSELTTRYLMEYGLSSVIVSNRSYAKAEAMAQLFSGQAVRFDQLPAQLGQADIVISCTAANHYVLNSQNCGDILKARQGRRIIIIDIAVPRDVDPVLAKIDGVQIYDIDKLQHVIDVNYLERKKASRQAEKIIQEELDKFNEKLASLYVVPVISALKEKAEIIKNQELKRAFNRVDLSEHEKKVVSTLANNIINQLLHHPMVSLKEMACSNQGHLYAEVSKKLFDLSVDMEEMNVGEVEIGQPWQQVGSVAGRVR